ncbi:hypothetical protein HHL21_15850 [Massilia sp. RP-1-19]|uniref:Uncharacterized protein n=1 Tax=Massilia polaris TaxID=2728846 RepID=A0A848HS02_9BURK|nr:hypothetical protein [Massilia polaris]NML62521.1 hypothetical protein [Massilia polaris]
MSNSGKHSPASLAARRQALVTECALQRITAAREVRGIMAPVHNLRHKVGGNFAIPVSVLGLIGGLIATRSGKLVPMLTTVRSLWKLGRDGLAAWRQRT